MSALLHEWIARAEADTSLREPSRLRERLDALDRLELHAEGLADTESLARVASLRTALEAVNHRLYADLREGIRQGRPVFAPWLDTLESSPDGAGYDYRDDLVSGVLALDEPGEAMPLPPEMVFYQPTPARHVFDLIRRTGLGGDDMVVDLGSGLGIVPLLIASSTPAHAVGVECEAAYVEASRRGAQDLGISRVSFECADAREADLSRGTWFYLYTPFTGSVMRNVLDALRCEASRRSFGVATFGPCTAIVAAESWLHGPVETSEDRVALFGAGRTGI